MNIYWTLDFGVYVFFHYLSNCGKRDLLWKVECNYFKHIYYIKLSGALHNLWDYTEWPSDKSQSYLIKISNTRTLLERVNIVRLMHDTTYPKWISIGYMIYTLSHKRLTCSVQVLSKTWIRTYYWWWCFYVCCSFQELKRNFRIFQELI